MSAIIYTIAKNSELTGTKISFFIFVLEEGQKVRELLRNLPISRGTDFKETRRTLNSDVTYEVPV